MDAFRRCLLLAVAVSPGALLGQEADLVGSDGRFHVELPRVSLYTPSRPEILSYDLSPFSLPELETGDFKFSRNPRAFDFDQSGAVADWDGGAVVASGGRYTLPGLFVNERAAVAVSQEFGRFSFTAGVSADRYQLFRGIRENYGIHGTASFRLNEKLSLNIFGSYYSNASAVSPAMLPYVGVSSYGGYLGMQFNDRFGMDLGVQRTYNVYSRQWETVPIVSPYVSIKNVKLGFDVGWLIRDLLEQAIVGDRYESRNPTFGPLLAPMPPVR